MDCDKLRGGGSRQDPSAHTPFRDACVRGLRARGVGYGVGGFTFKRVGVQGSGFRIQDSGLRGYGAILMWRRSGERAEAMLVSTIPESPGEFKKFVDILSQVGIRRGSGVQTLPESAPVPRSSFRVPRSSSRDPASWTNDTRPKR
eukprot:130237-Rhodomonas_salina.1